MFADGLLIFKASFELEQYSILCLYLAFTKGRLSSGIITFLTVLWQKSKGLNFFKSPLKTDTLS